MAKKNIAEMRGKSGARRKIEAQIQNRNLFPKQVSVALGLSRTEFFKEKATR